MNKKQKLILVLMFLIGFILRAWKIGSYPPLLWDEAGLGYNAYSILKTGRDEYGKFMPLIFKSFGDYKPGLYVYLTLPFVAVFGLNEIAVRLPAVILGSLTPIVLYFLVYEVTKNKKLSFLSSFSLVFLPWHIHFSRGAWEVTLMIFFLVLGSYLAFKKRGLFLLPFFLALLTYQGAKMMVPLVLLGLIFGTLNGELIAKIKFPKFIVPSLVLMILIALYFFKSLSGNSANRLKVMSLFSYHRPVEEINMILTEDGNLGKNLCFYIFHGEWWHFLRGALTRYFNHFSPKFLAFEGDWTGPRHSAPYFGVIGHLNFILMVFGLLVFVSRKRSKREYFFLYWLLFAPLPAALSRDIVTAVRSLPLVVPIAFFIGYGLYYLLNKFRNKWFKFLFFIFLGLNFIYWLDLYFNHMVNKFPREWLYGYKEVINYINDKKGGFENIFLTDFYGQPHIYYLFYNQYPPIFYQQQAKLTESQSGDVGKMEKIDNIFFTPADWYLARENKSSLVIFSYDEFIRSTLGKSEEIEFFKPLGVIGGLGSFYIYEKR